MRSAAIRHGGLPTHTQLPRPLPPLLLAPPLLPLLPGSSCRPSLRPVATSPGQAEIELCFGEKSAHSQGQTRCPGPLDSEY